ncbi:MAG: DNA alkylation repair protein [Fuerstiella sp.]
MESVAEVMAELKQLGNETTRKTLARHGAPENMFGVKVGDLKKVAKKIKGQQQLALDLYSTGNSDAMYLAGIVADGSVMNKATLQRWATNSEWYMIAEYSVPGVTCENAAARDLAMKWISAKKQIVQTCGWTTYSGIVATQADQQLDLKEIRALMKTVEQTIHDAPHRVRYTMNGFVIAVGCSVAGLLKEAKRVAVRIGPVSVDMGATACKVPLATEYIDKVESMNRIGKKRKTIKC